MAESNDMNTLAILLVGVVGLFIVLYCLITGVAAMNGSWRRWAAGTSMYQFGKHNYLGFMGFYLLPFLAFGILLVIGVELRIDWFSTMGPQFVLSALMVLALTCLFRLPRFMLPQWYKDWLDSGADKEQLRKPEYSSPFTWLRRSKNVHR
ncbi:hypothetical protein LJ754_11525 [Arthrobacter sp. zg-Y40]|uniref:hypothetical protein n=1 Tax=unclassified Arthrobacter TaxID=235627 RepID=UPI001D154898|nr:MULTISPECIES: hypothetical protein [unclassified Arthrobacter]MCC3279779.1 hypothetical protein [Arthrobacter sp. zg-Y40]MDK1328147.1 hypothetical protein [Arthrobacter sp. zg-Y1143]